jgi:nitroimidazol reductase NimA-like FMN-containing flavoprotein (pyridoxamine 5'-phosphate oxidase superfamily)
MPKNYATLEPTNIRRRDRAVNDETWIRDFLETAPVGMLATNYEGQPFINSNIFAFDADAEVIYLHTARVGRTRSNAESDDTGVPACFHIMQMGRLLPAKRALEFSVEYAGVMAFGTLSVIDDIEHAKLALQVIMDKYAPHLKPEQDYEPATLDDLKRTSVYQFDIKSVSGKRKVVAEDFPGAYWFNEQTGYDPMGMIRRELVEV